MPYNLKQEDKEPKNYNPKGEDLDVLNYLKRRIPVLKETKKNILNGFNFEQLMKDADKEYIPHSLSEGKDKSSVMLVQDEIKGLRGSRVVPIGKENAEEWRSDVSAPILMAKVQTALSILMGQNPDATFKAINEKFKKRTEFAYSLWKRSWTIGRSRQQMKLIIFDLAKYGWAIGRTYPRYLAQKGKVLTEINDDHPEKNKYDEVDIVRYNDIFRERLDPHKTWIDDMANLTDPYSMSDWYYEKDYSWDAFQNEFGNYKNIDFIKKGERARNEDDEEDDATAMRDDIITVGFYESSDKDLYSIYIPSQDVCLYYSPLPNDKKKLSCWWNVWNIRDPKTPYGIGLYEIMRNDKVLYDRVRNMDVDQLVMAIYPMLFYTGGGGMTNQGDFTISPALIKQKAPGTNIEQVEIKYDDRGREGVEKIAEDIDEITGITKTLQGEIEGKTLGETLHAKDSALKRLAVPLKNISHMIEDEAFISLSWMKQIYSIPEIKRFTNEEELLDYEKETGKTAQNVIALDDDRLSADFFPTFEMALEDRDGMLIESKEDRFFTMGEDVDMDVLDWEGMIEVNTMSFISPTPELERQRKLELYNLIQPTVGQITLALRGSPETGEPDIDTAIALAKPVIQILEIQDEKPKMWLPDELIDAMENPEEYKAKQKPTQPPQPGQMDPLFVSGGQSVVPRNEVTNPMRKTLGEVSKPRV